MEYTMIDSTITIVHASTPFTFFSLNGLVKNSKVFKPAIHMMGITAMPNNTAIIIEL